MKSEVTLIPMTREICHRIYACWENDPAICADPARFRPYVYTRAAVDRYYDERQDDTRLMLAVLLRDEPIGEIQLKRIDRQKQICTLSIHLVNDRVKGHGYGTQAVRRALQYAFAKLGMREVLADAVIRNTRSQHVLEKTGFVRTGEDADFVYYRALRPDDV